MGVIANIGYTDFYDVIHRVDIELAGHSGSNLDLIGTDTPIVVQHESLDPKSLFKSPVIKSNVTIEFYIDDPSAKTLVDNIIASTEGNYQFKYYIDGVLERTVDILADQGDFDEQSAGRTVQLTGKDFSRLAQTTYPLTTGRVPIIEVIADLLPYGLPITTMTSWVNENQANVNRDFLGQIYIERRALRNYASSEEEVETEILTLDALEYLVRNFKVFIKQVNGRWHIEQMSAFKTPTSVLTTLYDTNGTFSSASNTNRTQFGLTIRDISTNSPLPGLKRVEHTFNHRQRLQGIALPEVFRLPEFGLTTREFTQAFVADGTKAIRIGGSISLGFVSNVTTQPYGQIQIKSGTYYFNNQSRAWSETPHIIEIKLEATQLGEQGQPVSWNVYAGYYGIETTPVPVAGGNITLTYFQYPQSPVASVIAYSDNEFTVVGDEENQIATSIRYNLEQSQNFSVNYNDGAVLYGEGPVAFSDSALSSLNTTTSQIVGGWYRRGTITDWSFAELFTREVMEFQLGSVRLLNAIVMSDVDTSKLVSYDSTAFYMAGSSYNVRTGTYTLNLVDIAFADATATLTVGFISGPASIGQGTYNAINIATREAFEAQGQIQYRLSQTASGTITQLIVRNELSNPYIFRKDEEVLLVHPVTLDKDRLVVATDQFAGSNIIQVTSTALSAIYPVGSWVFVSQNSLNAGIIVGRDAVNIFAEGTNIGVTTIESLGSVTSLQAVMNTRVQAGDDLFVINSTNGAKRAFTINETAGPGLVTLQLNQSTVFDAPAGSYIIGSTAQFEGFLQVTPAGVLAKATASTVQNSFAVLSAPLPSGTPTASIPVTSVRTLRLLDESQIGVQDRAGNTEFFEVDGQQDLTGATTTITVVSKSPSVAVGAGAGVFQPMWNQTAILSVQAFEISQRVTGSEVQTLIDQNIDGLLPALSLPFENSDEGFTPTSATLTTTATYLEYLATGSTPFMQRTTSYTATDNPIVTLRVQRIAGTNWGGAFGWSTDGTNFTTQNFIEPAGVDGDFQFTTIDLTSNGGYTGTITAIRIYLGEANLDEFYIDSLSVGKFNPQTEILADLSSRLTVAEAGLLNTSTEFTTYTQNGVLLNGSAKVAVIRNATTTYETVILTDTRGGFTVRDNQDYYLVNEDGTFQAIKIDGNQTVTAVTTPTTFTLDIQSVNFATTIEVGAVLYESAFTQSTRISQTAGTIVLQASETDDEVTSLALIRLDGTGPSTAVTIQGDLVAINDIEIVRGVGAAAGLIRSNNFVSGVSGWRIQGTGNAEFNDVTVRGSVFVTGGDAATETYADGVAGDALDDALDNLSVTIRSGTEPTQRPNLDVLRTGDVWIDTANGDKPYSWNGSAFIAAYTQISGGAITTGTINADLVTVSGGDGNVTIDNTGISLSSGTFDEKRSLVFGSFATGVLMSSTTEGILYLGGVDGNGMSIGSGGDISNLLQLEFRVSNVKIATVTEASTSSTTGTIQVPNGGIGVAGASYFDSTVTVGNATSGGHALNRTTADGRYGQLGSANTWTLAQTFVNEITINDEIRMGTAGANKPIVFATQDGGSNDITVSLQAQNGGTAGNKTVTIPNATGTLVTTANYNQDIAGNKNFTGTLRAGGSTGQTTVVDTGAVILTFTKGLLTGVS
jgi:hypothetical protein